MVLQAYSTSNIHKSKVSEACSPVEFASLWAILKRKIKSQGVKYCKRSE